MTDFLGLPVFKRMYGFGDTATLRSRSVIAFLGGADARAIVGAVPAHRLLQPIPGAPLVLMQSGFTSATDNGDPDENDHRYHEVMLAAIVAGVGTPVPALFPLILFVDDLVAMTSGREFYGFPKVPAEVSLEHGRAHVRYTSFPRGERRITEVLRSSWNPEPGILSRAVSGAVDFIADTVRAAGVDDDTIDLVSGIMLAPAGQILNIRQLPDLRNPRQAALTQLTRFSPRLLDPTVATIVSDFELELPDEPIWSLGKRFFRGEKPRTLAAFDWSVTMKVTTGEVLESW
ncbi:MAG TPA: acetoacetate decarboxylase family protein [Labilithrix sp.]|nr:acetoacetate decarboxylase family protein [Labilithrix sp.]